MTQNYNLKGMTCGSCEVKVKTSLFSLNGITSVVVSKENGTAIIGMDRNIPTADLQSVLNSKYKISDKSESISNDKSNSFFQTYKPVLLIFLYIFCSTGLIEIISDNLRVDRWMRHFMACFFLIFSFFKLLNLKGFKESYAMYDIVAKKFPNWGYIYAFIELIIGIAFLINFNILITSSITFLVMSISIVGVLQTVLDKKTIKCACLGNVFNLPMSTVTIVEDGMMIIMSAVMLMNELL